LKPLRPKQILDKLEKFDARLLARLRPWAYPAHGMTLPPVLLFALMKSGSVFIQRALRRTLEVEIQHISAGDWFSYPALVRFAKGNSVSREHMNPSPELAPVLADFNIRRAVIHVRDPRAAIVSWTHQMERNLAERGLRYLSFSCRQTVPGAYLDWDLEARLKWQIEHVMPQMVAWIEGWVDIADKSEDVKFLVTDFAEMARDNRAFIEKLLKFYEVPYQQDWVDIPRRAIGTSNIYSGIEPSPSSGEAAVPAPARAPLSAEVSALANAGVPDRLIDRFGWARLPNA